MIYNLGKKTVSELQVDKIINHRCCVSSAKLDVAFMSPCGKLVYAIQQIKKVASGIETKTSMKDIQQLAAYMISALAFSLWGAAQKKGNETISGLVIYPTAIYRFSIWKPSESDKCPFGLMHKIEMTTDPLMMGWVFETFLDQYKADYDCLKAVASNSHNVNPVLLTPINYNLGTPLREASKTNLGFLFKSNSQILTQLIEHTPQEDLRLNLCVQLKDIAPDVDLIVKYLSALLTVPVSCENILMLIYELENLKKKEELVKMEEEGNRLRAELAALKADRLLLDDGVTKTIGESGKAEVVANGESSIKSRLGIKHPYIGVITFDNRHPLIVMWDVGTSMWEEIKSNNLQARWRSSPQLRRNFASDVGESALNLVVATHKCHNDIRLPNIAVKGNSFCLIDFDLSAATVMQHRARFLKHFKSKSSKTAMMMFSIAQIALVVFQVDCSPTPVDVVNVSKFWFEGDPGNKKLDLSVFEGWVKSKGALLEAVFSDLPPASLIQSKDEFMGIIDAIVQ